MPANSHHGPYLLILLIAVLGGCAQPEQPVAPGRIIAHGTVTLDGQSLGWGEILFLNQDHGVPDFDREFPAAISRGQFKIEITPGTYRVEIRQFKSGDSQEFEGTPSDSVQTLPRKYNDESEFTAMVTANGPNQFTYPLTSSKQE